jgi:sortase B
MPSFIIRKYNDNGIYVKINNRYKINSTFMLDQDALDYDVLYYKKDITINKEYDGILDDIKEFLRINYNLKAVNLYVYSKELIKEIIELIKNDESKNVVVLLHQSSDKGNFIEKNFAWLKKLNEDCKQELTCEFRIIYSHNYIRNNLFKQLSFNNLKLIAILSIYLAASGLIIYKSYEYVEKLNSDKVKTDILNKTANSLDMNEDLSGIDVELGEDLTDKEVKSKYQFDNIMSKLKEINKETVGFLVVNNTNISYPVVQHSDNSYYLKHDFYQKSTTMGWIYLDYRNNKNELDSNNIIYGHSMKNGTMFGTLKKVLSATWRKEKDNMIISYDNNNTRYKFVIFSIYKVDYTTDYLKVDFDGEKDFNDFVTMIKKRSVFKSNEVVNYGDKILTLSTCTGSSNQRLVVHAVMMKEGETNE